LSREILEETQLLRFDVKVIVTGAYSEEMAAENPWPIAGDGLSNRSMTLDSVGRFIFTTGGR
jgi:hypothetical protein